MSRVRMGFALAFWHQPGTNRADDRESSQRISLALDALKPLHHCGPSPGRFQRRMDVTRFKNFHPVFFSCLSSTTPALPSALVLAARALAVLDLARTFR